MSLHCAWIATPLLPGQSHFVTTSRTTSARPVLRCPPAKTLTRRTSPVYATAQPKQHNSASTNTPSSPPQTPFDPRGINGTTPFYIALVAAQLLPFVKATSGLAGDFIYFTVTALSTIVIGVRRAPLEPPALSAALSSKQAIAAPFTASIFLFGSYLLLKYTSLDINLIFKAVTVLGGTFCLKESLDPVVHSLLSFMSLQDVVVIPGEDVPEDGDAAEARPPFMLANMFSSIAAVGTIAAYLFHLEPSFVFSNVIAVALGARVLSIIKPSSFLVAAGLLTGLFFYDIFWVFGSEVMVSVATQIDMPGKLLFPRDPALSSSGLNYPYAILGLGDVCIPGLFITIAQSLDEKFAANLPKVKQPYFLAAMTAYTSALCTCFFVNYQTSAAQPALLYLVPALIASSVAVGAVRGELKDVLFFSNEDEGDAEQSTNSKETTS